MLNVSLNRVPSSFVEDEEDQDQQILPDRAALRWYSKLVCLTTFGLIFAGALVTSNQAGLSVPDWPTSYGHNMFLFPYSAWQGNIFYEHLHRLLASGVGVLATLLTFWIAFVEERPWVRMLSYAALFSVVCQGALGGATVLLQLPAAVSSLHGVLGQTFFCLTIILAYSQSHECKRLQWVRPIKHARNVLRLAIFTGVLIYLQLIIGAVMRHTESGLAVPDFPTMGGNLLPHFDAGMLATVNQMRSVFSLPPVEMGQVLIHFFHRFSGMVVFCGVLLLGWRLLAFCQPVQSLRRAGVYLPLLVIVQFGLGIATILSWRDPLITSLHVLGGALLLGLTVLLAARLFLVRSLQRRL